MVYHELTHIQEFQFEAGGSVPGLTLAYHISSQAPAGAPVVWICHALTANSDPSDWWPGMVGSGKLLDPQKYRIVCVNMLGSCYGSSGPASPKGSSGMPYLFDFPKVTIRDIVRGNILVREHLGIDRIDLLIGSSIGGFQALEWAVMEPDVISSAIFMATSPRISPWMTAWEESQRMALEADPTFRTPASISGPVAEYTTPLDSAAGLSAAGARLLKGGEAGLKAARAIALISYRSYSGYCLTQPEKSEDTLFADRAASYERYQGKKLADRFDAYSYYYLANSLDSHNVGRGRGGVESALAQIKAASTVISIDSDGCFPPVEMKALAAAIPGAVFHSISSAFGHDGFLLENDQITAILAPILKQINNK